MLVLPETQKGGEKMSSDDASEFKDMYGKVVSKIKSLD
jgi:H/ACA ribonucleoprotein complex subunit 2